MSTFETTINKEVRGMDCDLDVTVHYTAVPFSCGSTDGPGGPKLEPDEPAHIDIDYVEDDRGEEVVLSRRQEREIEEQIAEYLNERDNASC